jgi:2-keto-3-deoxy-L-rhamnonate aldolase RhmA
MRIVRRSIESLKMGALILLLAACLAGPACSSDSPYRNPLREALISGRAVYGGFVVIPDPAVVENLAIPGRLDFVWLETEHSVMSYGDVQAMVRAAESPRHPITPIVRVPGIDLREVKRYLGTGVRGVVFPSINNAAEARQAVACTRYAPRGIRPAGVERAHGYLEHLDDYMKYQDLLVVIMIETEEGARNIGEIARVEGVDVVHLGPYDMALSFSGALGLPPGADRVKAAVKESIERIEATCRQACIPLGTYVPSHSAAREKIEQGYRFFTIPDDALLIRQGVRDFFNDRGR